MFASEEYSEEVLLDVALHGLGEGCDCRCVWRARWALLRLTMVVDKVLSSWPNS